MKEPDHNVVTMNLGGAVLGKHSLSYQLLGKGNQCFQLRFGNGNLSFLMSWNGAIRKSILLIPPARVPHRLHMD
jgi:hypothetical protein